MTSAVVRRRRLPGESEAKVNRFSPRAARVRERPTSSMPIRSSPTFRKDSSSESNVSKVCHLEAKSQLNVLESLISSKTAECSSQTAISSGSCTKRSAIRLGSGKEALSSGKRALALGSGRTRFFIRLFTEFHLFSSSNTQFSVHSPPPSAH